jgi:starvation-inducible DNA-binding protein
MTPTANTAIKIDAASREKLIDLLNSQLALLCDLESQLRFAHWNVRGMNFASLHELFEKLADQVRGEIDDVAERATTLGGVAKGTVRQVATASTLKDLDSAQLEGQSMVKNVAMVFSPAAEYARRAISASVELGDDATADLFTGLTRTLDKAIWFLEAHTR